MSTKRKILTIIAMLLSVEILTIVLLTLFFPNARVGFVRDGAIDKDILDNIEAAKLPTDLSDFENLIKLQQQLDKAPNFSMQKESKVTATQSPGSYAKQEVYDSKEKKDNKIYYQSIQINEGGSGLAGTFAPGNAGTKVEFDLQTGQEQAVVTKASKVDNKDSVIWGSALATYTNVKDYTEKYGNWGNYITDYHFQEKSDIENPDLTTVTFDFKTKLYTLKVVAEPSAAGHYKNKIIALGNGSVNDVQFDKNCAILTFQFDKNWKIMNYTIEESYKTITKVIVSIKTNTQATHTATFSY